MKIYPIIPAVKGFKELDLALKSPSINLILLEGEIIHLPNIIKSVKRVGKKIFVHLELLKGIKEDEAAIHYLAKEVKIDGIISTRSSSLILGKKHHLITIQRGFLLDSQSLQTIIKTAQLCEPDFLELLPSYAYPEILEIKRLIKSKIISGGFIKKKEDIQKLVEHNIHAISTSKTDLWYLASEEDYLNPRR